MRARGASFAFSDPTALLAFAFCGVVVGAAAAWLLPPYGMAVRVVSASAALITALCGFMTLAALPGEGGRRREYSRLALMLGLLAMVVFIAWRFTTTSFAIDDEIYSWNMWAVQHFEGRSADFFFTRAAYPQLMPYWMASLYDVAGSTRAQFLPRLGLTLSALGFFGTLAATAVKAPVSARWLSIGLIALSFAALERGGLFSIGLADPLMSAALVISAACCFHYSASKHPLWLWLSVATGCIAAFTKQAGLCWSIVSLPCIAVYYVLRRSWPRPAIFPPLCGAALALTWPLYFGAGFSHNEGVIQRSLQGRSLAAQLLYAGDRYLIHMPLFGLLFVAFTLFCCKEKTLRPMALAAVLPMLLLWFLFGSYELRLGLHVIGLMLLSVIWALARAAPEGEEAALPPGVILPRAVGVGMAAALAIFVLAAASGHAIGKEDGVEMTITQHYGSAAPYVIREILDKKAPVFATNCYVYGVFYGQVPVERPAREGAYTLAEAKETLRKGKAEYLIDTGEFSSVLACPSQFTPVGEAMYGFRYHLYKIHRDELSRSCP